MKLHYFILITLILIIPLALADIDKGKALDWLLEQRDFGAYNDDVIDTSAAVMAITNVASKSSVDDSIAWLLSQKNAANCWPSINCRVKETAFALMALNSADKEVNDIVEWLKDARTSTSTSGKFWLQVANANSGTCTIKYTKENTNEITKEVTIVDGKFPDCNNNNWFDLNLCLEPNLLNKEPSISFDVDCNAVSSSNPVISLIFQSGTTYHILENIEGSSGKITVDNNCYGIGFKDPCNFDSTLYASWAQSQVTEPSSLFFLRTNYNSNDPEHSAIMYLITEEDKFLKDLEDQKSNDGSFKNDVFKTSLALLTKALEEEQTTRNWLESKQNNDGSLGSIFNTAFVLQSAASGTSLDPSTCFDDIKNNGEQEVDCGGPCTELCDICNFNDVCEEERGEDNDNCSSDCLESDVDTEDLCDNGRRDSINNEEGIDCGGSCLLECPSCNNDGVCEFDAVKETALHCPNDCSCGDDICDSSENEFTCASDCEKEETTCNNDGVCDFGETIDNCSNDCSQDTSNLEDTEEGGSTILTIFVIIILLAILGFGYYFFFMKKKSTKKPKGLGNLFKKSTPKIPKFPGSKPNVKHGSRNKELETELEQSLDEARKLMKGK